MAQANTKSGVKTKLTRQYSFTRPADTTAYASNDAMSNSTSAPVIMSWAGCAATDGASGTIRGVTIAKSTATITACDFDLFIFDTAPNAFEDNAAFDMSDAEAATVVGFVEFLGTDSGVSTLNAVWCRTNLDIPYVVSSTNTLYGVLVARAAYTPASGEVFYVTLHLEQD